MALADRYRIRPRATLGALVLLTACGGGQAPVTEQPSRVAPPVAAVSGPDSFLLFPNPLVQADGKLQSNTREYAEQYYKAVDPGGLKDTLKKWMAANCIDATGGVQVSAVFRDPDLGYGRRMTGRHNTVQSAGCVKDSVAFMVENYLVNPGGASYGDRINLDAAILQDRQWRANVNAIEFSPGPGGGLRYAKFYSFDPISGQRLLVQDMDGRGEKALPGVCLGCHGGRVDPLDSSSTLPAAGASRFAQLLGPNSQQGDTRGRLHPFEVGALEFSDQPGYTRPDQQGALKALNRMVLCSYPRSGASAGPEDDCRQPAETREWSGGAATLIKNAYGGNGLPSGDYREPPVPAAWSGTASRALLYRDVVVPSCRSCHLLRGSGLQSEIDFSTADGFDGYAARHRSHVFERGNMPMSRLAFDRFWNSGAPAQLADYLQALAVAPVERDAAGKPLRPGRPVADPGPDRRVRPGATRLSAAGLYADSHQWTLASYPGGATVAATEATLAGADTANPVFTALAAAAGKRYQLTLVSSRGAERSAAARLVLYVNASAGATDADKAVGDIDPAKIDLARMQGLLTASCSGCHAPAVADGPPISFLAPASTAEADALYQRLRGIVNFTDLAGSALLRKPAGHSHGGNRIAGFDDTQPPGDAGRRSYDEFVNWAVNGAMR